MRWWLAVAVTCVCACGRLSFDAVGGRSGDDASTDDAAGDHRLPDGGAPDGSVSCGAFSTLSDTFTGAPRDVWDIEQAPGTSASQTTGDLRLTLAGGTSTISYAGYSSVCDHDFRGHTVTVEITKVITESPGAEMFLNIFLDNLSVGIDLVNGQLYAEKFDTNGSQFTGYGQTTFDPVAHRFWRFSEAAGTMTFETSPDAAAFTTLGTAATPFDVSSTKLWLRAGTFELVGSPGVAGFDNLVAQ